MSRPLPAAARSAVRLPLRRVLSIVLLLSLVLPVAPFSTASAASEVATRQAGSSPVRVSVSGVMAGESGSATFAAPVGMEQAVPEEPLLPPLPEPPAATAEPPIAPPGPSLELPTATPLLPVALSLGAEGSILAQGGSLLLTLRVESLGSAESAPLPAVDVTLLLPAGVVTAEGWSGSLRWKGIPVAPGAPFVQTLHLQVDEAGGAMRRWWR